MKFRVTFKDPDGVWDSIDNAAKMSAASVKGIDDDEREDLVESRREHLDAAVEKWIKWSEYLTVEFDTDAGTATVIPTND